jgi:hypothetical protein
MLPIDPIKALVGLQAAQERQKGDRLASDQGHYTADHPSKMGSHRAAGRSDRRKTMGDRVAPDRANGLTTVTDGCGERVIGAIGGI